MQWKISVHRELNESFGTNNLKGIVLEEAHGSRYSIQLGFKNMYCDLKEVYWLDALKRKIAEFVSNCRIAKT